MQRFYNLNLTVSVLFSNKQYITVHMYSTEKRVCVYMPNLINYNDTAYRSLRLLCYDNILPAVQLSILWMWVFRHVPDGRGRSIENTRQ